MQFGRQIGRITLAAALVVLALLAVLPGVRQLSDSSDPVRHDQAPTVASGAKAPHASAARAARSAKARPSVIFFDASIAGLGQALARSHPEAELHPLAGADPFAQIATVLAGRSGIGAIHIVSHGEAGAIKIDGRLFGRTALASAKDGPFAAIRHALAPGAEILIYGCDIGKDPAGKRFAADLAKLTGAHVAVSQDEVVFAPQRGAPALAYRTGAIATQPLSIAGWTGRLWTTELYEGGWYGDTNCPNGAPTLNLKSCNASLNPATPGGVRFTAMGDLTSGTGATVSGYDSGGASVAKLLNTSATPTTYAAAVTAGTYFSSDLVVGSSGMAIDKVTYNQVSLNTAGAQMQLALYDTVTTSLTPLGSAFTISGSATTLSVPISAASYVPMVPGRTYQLRFYTYSCGAGKTCYLDNPALYTMLNQAPTATNDAFSTLFNQAVSGNLVTTNNGSGVDSDPENQALSVDQVNGAGFTVGGNIALANGTLVITNANGAFTFTPNTGFAGTQTFTYRVNDGFGGTASATVTITVAASTVAAAADTATRYGGGLAYANLYSVRTNDTVGGVAASGSNSTLSAVTAVPSQLTFDSATGNVGVNAGAAPGTYSFTYKLCSTASPLDCQSATATVILTPPLTATKTSTAYSDPINATVNPKEIPGGWVSYTITLSNPGSIALDSSTLVLTDPVPANLQLFVANYPSAAAPVVAVDGVPASGLSFTYTNLASTTDNLDFSNDGGATWTYVPTPNTNGVDPAVTAIRIRPQGSLGAGKTYSFKIMYLIK